ncbi:unnamed protein product [Brassica oleracea var. botrytis]
MSTDLVPKPSSKDDSRAYKSGVAAENTTIPLKKSLLARNDSEAGANNNGVSNPNAAGNPLATNDYQSTVRRSALFLCVEAFRGEASTMLQLRTQAIRALMKRWNIPHVSIDSFPHALVPNAGDEARSSNHSNIQEKLVTTKPQSAGDEARRSSHSNIQEKLVTTKPQSAGDDNVDRRSSHSNIPSQHNFEADLVPPTQQRVRKLAERFSTIEQQPFSCMCGQKFYAKSNLPTHKKRCLASKEEVDEEEDLAWAQKKRRSGGY